ncbi:MAG TPA: GNAT family N-acetyltransferase [Methanobacterium sp.]|nr:GNAT family N-acetyltransferase [Methanobacterium sp.]
MQFQKMDRHRHDSGKVAAIIYEADVDTFNFFFGNKPKASEKIAKLVAAGDNDLGYQQTYVVTNGENEILGVMVYSTAGKGDKIRQLKVLFKNLNVIDSFKFIMIEILDNIFLSDLEVDDFYFAIIAVDEDSRGKGIGSFIIEEGIKLAREKGCKRAVLDVDMENEGALRFYKRLRFKKFNKKIISLFGWEKGVYNMEYLF